VSEQLEISGDQFTEALQGETACAEEISLYPFGFILFPSRMADALWMKIREVEWESYEISSGNAKGMPTMLKNLASRKLPRAMKASHQVWTALCGGGRVHSATLPALPFLVEIMEISDPAVQDGIVDILTSVKQVEAEDEWQTKLKQTLEDVKPALGRYRKSSDEIVAAKVSDLLS